MATEERRSLSTLVSYYGHKHVGPYITPKVLGWLPPLPSRERHNTFSNSRAEGVGHWLLREETFSTWHTPEDKVVKSVLLCYGGPGVGKTFISSLVIDTLGSNIGSNDKVIAYVYCDFSAQNEQSVSSVLGSVLSQALGKIPSAKGKFQSVFEMAEKQTEDFKLRLHGILEMLIGSISAWKRFFICIDALDEFPTKQRAQLWESLRHIVRECPNTRLFLTGRPQIREEAAKYFPRDAEMVSINSNIVDIKGYIEQRLEADLEPDGVDEELRADILRIIPEKFSGMFLLVVLKMDEILREVTIHKRRQVLGRMTNGLDLSNVYGTTLDRIRQQGGSRGKLGIEALMWISYSKRPLDSEELCYALGVELGERDFKAYNVPSIRTILGCTLGLVTIDEATSTVRLLHPTLQDYLVQHPTLFATAHSMMAEICLTYLNCQSVRTLRPSLDTVLGTATFLEYATCFWGIHATMGATEQVKSLALRLLDGYENHVSASILWEKKIRKWNLPQHVHGISGLHCIAFWGIAEIAISMLQAKRWDANYRDSEGDTPLIWAVKYGNGKLAELLQEQGGTESEAVAARSHAVPSPTAQWLNKGLAKLLPERGNINPNSPDRNRGTTRSYTMAEGFTSAVKLLQRHGGANPDPSDNNGRTPPPSVGELGKERYQLKRFPACENADPNSPDEMGRPPSPPVAEHQKQHVPKPLLEHGNPDRETPEAGGRTTTSTSAQDPLGQETLPPPWAPVGVASHATGDFPLDASNSLPTISGPPPDQALPCKQSPPDQPGSASTPSTPTPILSFGSALVLLLLALILLPIFTAEGIPVDFTM